MDFSEIISNLFAIKKSITVSSGKMNHCSTITPHPNGFGVAWYSGTGECQPDQSVGIIFITKDGIVNPHGLNVGPGTGNPVLWTIGNELVLLYSKFENLKTERIVDRWKHCSLWLQRIIYQDQRLIFNGEPLPIAEPGLHLLGRCKPIITESGKFLLPLYDELNHHSVIYVGDGLNFEYLSSFGINNHIIQSTLWESNKTIYAISRNIGTKRLAVICYKSTDDGVTWDSPTPWQDMYNKNNSMHVVNYSGDFVTIWNDSMVGRDNLTLGILGENGLKRVVVLSKKYGSYPSVCVNNQNTLAFTYTNELNRISINLWSRGYYKKTGRRNKSGGNGGSTGTST